MGSQALTGGIIIGSEHLRQPHIVLHTSKVCSAKTKPKTTDVDCVAVFKSIAVNSGLSAGLFMSTCVVWEHSE